MLYACTPTNKSSFKLGELLALRQAPTQWQDFCEQIPIDKARDFITIFQLL